MTRPTIRPMPVFNSTTGQSMAGNLTSLVVVLGGLSMCGYGVSWTGTSPVGTLAVQVSNDYSLNAEGAVSNAGTWATLPFSVAGTIVTSLAVTGNTGSIYIDIDTISAYAILK